MDTRAHSLEYLIYERIIVLYNRINHPPFIVRKVQGLGLMLHKLCYIALMNILSTLSDGSIRKLCPLLSNKLLYIVPFNKNPADSKFQYK